jgi:hypothetical protein
MAKCVIAGERNKQTERKGKMTVVFCVMVVFL